MTSFHEDELPPPPPKFWLQRWRNHFILGTFLETSSVMQNGMSALSPATITQWFLLPGGVLIGGAGVHLVKWILDKMTYYLPSYVVLSLMGVTILGGPDLLPPMTLVNGCESMKDRLMWTMIFLLFRYVQENPPQFLLPLFENVTTLSSSFKMVMVVSGIWHFDRGDFHLKMISRIYSARIGDALDERNVQKTVSVLMLYQFQAAAGIGMLWAAFEIYSMKVFIVSMIIYLAMQIFFPRLISLFG